MGRVISNVSYTGPRSGGQSADSLSRYLELREREDGERERVEIYGDREAFREAAKERAEEGCRSSYVHAVISPERGQEYEDRDLEQLMDEWTRDRAGEQQPFVAAIHRDTDHPHVHVGCARDKFDPDELAEKKEITQEIAHDRERVMDLRKERDTESEREPEHQRWDDRDRGGLDRELEETGRERDMAEGR